MSGTSGSDTVYVSRSCNQVPMHALLDTVGLLNVVMYLGGLEVVTVYDQCFVYITIFQGL